MKINRKQFLPAVLIVPALLLGACGGTAATTTKDAAGAKGGLKTITLGMVNPPVIFNPINSSDVASTFLETFMFDSLIDMDGPLNFKPKLADSFETTDNQTYTVKLNQKAKWSDGQPVTADDVLFTYNLIANPKVETTVGAYIAPLDGLNAKGKLPDGQTSLSSVKKVDDHTVVIKTKQPVDPNMLKEQLGSKIMILPEHALKNIPLDKLSQDPFMQKPTVVDGAFKFVKYAKDQYVQFEKNPDYYRGAPILDQVFVKIMPAANLTAQLQTGEIQMNVGIGIGKLPVTDYDTVKKLANVRTKEDPTIGFQTMMFNTQKVADAKIRQALVYALDRQLIVDKLLKGTGEVVDGPYTSISPYLDKNLKNYTHDPEKAKQMLKDAGWDFNRTLQLVVPTGNAVREQSANLIAQNLEEVGVKTKITKYDFPTLLQKGKAGDFDLLLIGFTFTLDPDVTNLYAADGPYNFMKYNNPQVIQLLEKGKSEPAKEKRQEIYNQLQAIWEQDMPIITLYSDHDFNAISKKVTVGEPKIFGMTYNVNQWDVSGVN